MRISSDRLAGAAIRLGLAGLLAVQALPHAARAAEICRFAGTTDYDGRVAVTTRTTEWQGTKRVDVLLRFHATAMLFFHVQYLIEEISTWQAGQARALAVNNRYSVNGRIVRQQWDVFDPVAGGFHGYRIEGGSNVAKFRREYPRFAYFWNPATFGQDWLPHYWAAHPDRRPDLDLHNASLRAVRPPLAMAFYWDRWLPRGGQGVTVFLAGFKREKRADLSIASGAFGGGKQEQTALRYPELSESRPSIVRAWTTPDNHLLQLDFIVHSRSRSARGLIREQGCQGQPVPPG